jgi:hypothetical protein
LLAINPRCISTRSENAATLDMRGRNGQGTPPRHYEARGMFAFGSQIGCAPHRDTGRNSLQNATILR